MLYVLGKAGSGFSGNGETVGFHAVWPAQHELERHCIRGLAEAIAQQRHGMHDLAGAVNAAFGVKKCLQQRRHSSIATCSSADAAAQARPSELG